MQFSIYALSTFLIVTPVLVSAMPTTLDISSRNPKSIFTEIGDDLNDFGNSFQDSVVEFYETVVTGCKVVQCAEAISPTVLTCVVDAISNNPLGCLTAVSLSR